MKKSESKVPFGILIVVCFILLFISYKQKEFRRQLNEVKSLPYYANSLENVNDGIYKNKTETSFLTLTLEVTIENHNYKNIEIIESTGSKGKNIPKFIEKVLVGEEIKTPSHKSEMLEYLVFLSCLDGAIGNNENEITETQKE